MMVIMRRGHIAVIHALSVIGIVLATLIIMTAYIRVYLVVRRQVRLIPRVRNGDWDTAENNEKLLLLLLFYFEGTGKSGLLCTST